MAATERFLSQFTSIEGNEYTIWVTTDKLIADLPNTGDGTVPTYEFTLKEYGFQLQYQNDGDNIFASLRPSSLRFSWEIQGTADLQEFNTVVTNTDQNWYVSLIKNNVLDWFGYLKLENFIQPNAQPTSVQLEAVDTLTLIDDFKFLQNVYTGNVGYRGGVVGANDLIYGGTGVSNGIAFGRIAHNTPADNIMAAASPRADVGMATLIEFFWSLIYDVEPGMLDYTGSNDGPGGLSIMVKYDHILRTGSNSIWDEVAAQIYPYVYKDYRETDAFSLISASESGDYTIGDILRNVLELWNCRCFLSDGRYWIVQYRTYADSPFISSDYSTNPNNRTTTATSPQRDSIETSTLPDISNNTVTVDSGSTHFLKAGGQFQYLNRLQSFSLEHFYASGGKGVRAYINNVQSNNLASAELEDEEFGLVDFNPVVDTFRNNNAGATVHEGDYYLLTGAGWSLMPAIQETSTASFNSLSQLMAYGRVQARNAVNIKLRGTVISPELSYFQPIVYATQTYIPNEFTRFGNADEVRGSWIRLNLSNDDIELEDFETDDGA